MVRSIWTASDLQITSYLCKSYPGASVHTFGARVFPGGMPIGQV
jgi:hypothetical protein